MNKKGNQRGRQSAQRIYSAFLAMLSEMPISKITVTGICGRAQINRSTFYAHAEDVYDLLEQIEQIYAGEFREIFTSRWHEEDGINQAMAEMFRFILSHRAFYRAVFDGHTTSSSTLLVLAEELFLTSPLAARADWERSADRYHVIYFVGGLQEVMKDWLNRGCAESPEEMAEIIYTEYHRSDLD